VLVHPTVDPPRTTTSPGCALATYERLAAEVANPRIRWADSPPTPCHGRPRVALQTMIIRKKYGCTHFIIRAADMAAAKSSLSGVISTAPTRPRTLPEGQRQRHWAWNGPFPQFSSIRRGLRDSRACRTRGLPHVKKLSGTQFRKDVAAGDRKFLK